MCLVSCLVEHVRIYNLKKKEIISFQFLSLSCDVIVGIWTDGNPQAFGELLVTRHSPEFFWGS